MLSSARQLRPDPVIEMIADKELREILTELSSLEIAAMTASTADDPRQGLRELSGVVCALAACFSRYLVDQAI